MGQNQAWVTLATNDTYALGALVLGASLRKVGTDRQLVILITSGVSPKMREILQSSFDLLQEVDPFDSKDAAHLAILKRPDLGITLTKIHCWTLVQYTKCVFLDADTLVLSNCDELFQRPELSAVPDVGWPDCFNSGVFVFVPSMKTFEDLVSLADREGSYDGGDQGLLNSYFNDWATKDIARHLSFIYNMNSNAFYSYLPAFLKFKHNVKIVHFLGARKPWHYNFNLLTNQVECDCSYYQEHLQLWWNIFMNHVQPRLTSDCAGLAGEMTKLSIRSAEELRSFPAEQILGSEGRQFAWERGQIDYMGADAFANIQRKLDAAISPSPAASSPVVTASLTTAEQSQTILAGAPGIATGKGPAAASTDAPASETVASSTPPLAITASPAAASISAAAATPAATPISASAAVPASVAVAVPTAASTTTAAPVTAAAPTPTTAPVTAAAPTLTIAPVTAAGPTTAPVTAAALTPAAGLVTVTTTAASPSAVSSAAPRTTSVTSAPVPSSAPTTTQAASAPDSGPAKGQQPARKS